jgi:hypothetical protein
MNDGEDDETERLRALLLVFIAALSRRFPRYKVRN